jgi:hypothetical protein
MFRMWEVTNGWSGETCSNSHPDPDLEPDALWCQFLKIPDCVDRTINCTQPPYPSNANISVISQTNPNSLIEYGTELLYNCPDIKHYFDYPVGYNFISYNFTDNIDTINITCTKNRYAKRFSKMVQNIIFLTILTALGKYMVEKLV